MSESTKKFFKLIEIVILFIFTAIVFNRAGYVRGVKGEHDRLMQNAVDMGAARWEVDQRTGKSRIMWCLDGDKKETLPKEETNGR